MSMDNAKWLWGGWGGVGRSGLVEKHWPGQHYHFLLSLDLLICLGKVYIWDTFKFDLWGQLGSYCFGLNLYAELYPFIFHLRLFKCQIYCFYSWVLLLKSNITIFLAVSLVISLHSSTIARGCCMAENWKYTTIVCWLQWSTENTIVRGWKLSS